MQSLNSALPVAVLGAGPVGLAAAARLIERGLTPLVLEAGTEVGAHLRSYGHVRLFSPWRYNIDAAVAALLGGSGWQAPPAEDLPLAREVVDRVLAPFAGLPAVAPHVQLNTRVLSVSREGFDKVKTRGREEAPFVVRALQRGAPVQFRARAVIDATGTWSTPNPLGADGLPAQGELALGTSTTSVTSAGGDTSRIFYGIPDVLGRHRARYAGRRTLVVGAGHTAANALLALVELAESQDAAPGTRLVWAVRSPDLTRVFGGGDADALSARGALGKALAALHAGGGLEFVSGLHIRAVEGRADKAPGSSDTLVVRGHDAQGHPLTQEGIDQIICATGQRPDLSLTSELRLKLDPALESTEALGPLIDPNEHSCGTVRPHGHRELAHPEPGFYTLGVKSYGRAPTFLMATGFEQARSVVAAIAGDMAAADRVELDLPQTGVCSVNPGSTGDPAASGGDAAAAAACCGPASALVAMSVMPRQARTEKAACCG